MTGPDDRRRGLTPFDGGVKKTETDPHPHAALVDKKEGGGDKNSGLAGAGEDPSPPVNFDGAVTTMDSGEPVRDASSSGGLGRFESPRSDPCVGCAYCCAQAPCHFSMDKYCCAHPCPALYWNGERYRCADVAVLPLRDCCAIGAGCCSSLNTWRGSKIQRRSEIENPLPHHKGVESGHDL